MDASLLTPVNLSAFLARFGKLHDGLVRSITLKFRNGKKYLRVILSVLDFHEDDDGHWVNLELLHEDVTILRLHEDVQRSMMVLFAVQVRFENDEVNMDYDNRYFQDSDFLVGSKRCRWNVLPYTE